MRGNQSVQHHRHKNPGFRKALLALLLLPFLFLTLLPRGYMPSVQAEGGFTVTLCTPDGLRTVTLDASGVEIPRHSDNDEDKGDAPVHCTFASVGSFVGSFFALETRQRPGKLRKLRPNSRVVSLPVSIAGPLGARAPPCAV